MVVMPKSNPISRSVYLVIGSVPKNEKEESNERKRQEEIRI
jgi:hypothetical protein